MSGQRLADEALELANSIAALCDGKSTPAVYVALGMVLGRAAAQAERPDLHGLMRVITGLAETEFAECRR